MNRWLIIVALLAFALLLFTIIPGPKAPDLGTPDFFDTPDEDSRELPETATPTGGLQEIPLIVPEKWKIEELDDRTLNLPPGFRMSVFASGLGHARFMASDSDGNLYLSQPKDGTISVIPDMDRDGIGDQVIVFSQGLNQPHGLAFNDGWLYVAENDRVQRLKDEDGDLVADLKEMVIPDIPSGGGHYTRTIGFGPDGGIYVSVGSSCNICEDGPGRAAILRFNPDGSDGKVYASGLRNSVGFVWNPGTGQMWATDNGRDWLGDNLPPDEVNIVLENGHYGWPYCYGKSIPDPEYDDPDFCAGTLAPRVEVQAHSAPLGLRFYQGDIFPEQYIDDLFVAFHGSWNRKVPTGYKVVRIRMDGEKPIVEEFINGWLTGDEKWGRPVDIIFDEEGNMFISDDYGGVIYWVTYSPQVS